jgi:hypothetical protein
MPPTARAKLASAGFANNATSAQAGMSFPMVESTAPKNSEVASIHVRHQEGGHQGSPEIEVPQLARMLRQPQGLRICTIKNIRIE